MTENKKNRIETVKKEEYEYLLPDYPTCKKYENIQFAEKRYAIPKFRAVRIYCDGVFDMFHYGHARLFAQVKHLFPNVYLIAGVHSDEQVKLNKGDVVMCEEERYECLRHCKYIDEIVEDAPWILNDPEYLEKYQIDYVAHDEAPYPSATTKDIYEFVKQRGMFIPTKRATDISTTQIITGIIKDYDKYMKRQMLRGITHNELNLSFFTFQCIKLKFKTIEYCNKLIKKVKNATLFVKNLIHRFLRNRGTEEHCFNTIELKTQ